MSEEPIPVMTPQRQAEREKLYQLMIELAYPASREVALLELSKKNDPDLAPMLWNSFGTSYTLLQEVVNVYPFISNPILKANQSNRVCYALSLLQCVAAHPGTRPAFLRGQIPVYVYPFISTTFKSKPFEQLRLNSLGVIGALVETDDTEAISFLLSSEVVPLCLSNMLKGSKLTKSAAIKIIEKILLNKTGLSYICETHDRFARVATTLGKMTIRMMKYPCFRVLKRVVRCYLLITENELGRSALRVCLPDPLRDGTFSSAMQHDPCAKQWLKTLLKNLESRAPAVMLQVVESTEGS
uniref:CCR4-NOT transcription complex subunit 9 n=1 Tax=Drosophila simulans TaxID=7240 RepID=E0ZR53_DROSI|nr:Drcd-1r [Drosophila simulans]ADL67590.1 Drcd-1r [Drosophila simulans]ADL67592.1 Drcd-1r [Drosophila simulans]